MDPDFSKPKVSITKASISATANSARASVETHLQGRMPSCQQTSATLHGRMAHAPIRPSGPPPMDSMGSFSSDSSFSRPKGPALGQSTDIYLERDITSISTTRSPGKSPSGVNPKQESVQTTSGSARTTQNTFKTGENSSSTPHFNSSSSFPTQVPRNPSKTTEISSKHSIHVPAQSHVGPCKNPQCVSCGTVIIPSPKATYPIQERPSITIGDWSIFTIKGPICSSDELDALNASRYDFPLPEMIFGNNCVRLYHEKTGASIEFNTLDALDSLASHADYKVAYYKEWLSTRPKAEQKEAQNLVDKNLVDEKLVGGVNVQERARDSTRKDKTDKEKREGISTSVLVSTSGEKGNREKDLRDLREASDFGDSPPLESVKPYDWTYSTNYTGTVSHMQFEPSEESIPLEKLVRQDPILFFDESILFEDELGDNGISMYSTKVRVMGSCLLLLGRFSMRIDDVAFRIRDTRVYIDFDTGLVMREYKCQEASYETLLRKVSGRSSDPKKLLRDSNWVSQNTPVISKKVEIATLSGKVKEEEK